MKHIVATIQMNSTSDVDANLKQAEKYIAEATEKDAKLIVLPENFSFMGKNETDKLAIAENSGEGKIQEFLADQAKKQQIYLVGGSIPILSEHPRKIYNTCLVYNDHGKCVARYDKIHLFDAVVTSGSEVYKESSTVEHGNNIIVVDSPLGKMGVAICYDIRFPELFRAMALQGAEIFVIPTAFTYKTGIAHWETLTRARAIENFCYVLGACQTGTHDSGRITYGHSLIIDPWGTIIATLPEKTGVITAEIDLAQLRKIRDNFPVHSHRKIH